jgi:hypothetical protein
MRAQSKILPGWIILLAILLFPGQRSWAAGGGFSDLRAGVAERYDIDLYGFVEVRNGWRLQHDPYEKEASLAEARLQLDLSKDLGWGVLKLKNDFGADLITEEGFSELREANLLFSPHPIMDAKIGRQVITWGTGDLLFINDLFPKDWVSFFIGRDDEYLKAPSDAVKLSFFPEAFNLDLVYTPEFDPSRYIDGSRLSYWNGVLGRTAGRDFIFADHERNSWFRDSEYALRLSRNLGGAELALYGYHGFWKTPEGMDPEPRLIYPRLSVYGLSARAPFLGGIANLEAGYYDSLDDQHGNQPLVRNSEIRFLSGFEHELGRDFTGSIQYYLEYMQDYPQYQSSLSPGTPEADEYRHLFTLRLTRLFFNQNLTLSLFGYYSPSDQDAYLRPKVSYKASDRLTLETGGNIFAGSDDHTFFGQFDRNTNLYAGVRYSF